MSRRYLALRFPSLPTDRLRRQIAGARAAARAPCGAPAEPADPEPAGPASRDIPLVLAEPVRGALRLAALDRAALAVGLRPGMALADARARIPGLVARPHDPAADAALLARMAAACDRWTPLVALDPPAGLVLDVTGAAHLFGGEARLREAVAGYFSRAGFSAHAALAGTPDAARALARLGRGLVVPPGGEEAALRPLPVAALGLDPDTRAALAIAGLRRIADLADLPSGPLAARFGADLTARLARALGREDLRVTPTRAALACRVERRFPEPVARAGAIEVALGRLVAQAAAWLEAAGKGGRAFEASFFRADGGVRRLRVETGRPTCDPGAVLGLLRERLDALADPLDPGFGFDLIRLDVPVTEPLGPRQLDMRGAADDRRVGESGVDEAGVDGEDAVGALVDRLAARLGPSRVLRFAPADTHDPERAGRLAPVRVRTDAPWPGQEPGDPPLRPLHLFEPPQPIEAVAEVPDGPPLRFRWRGAAYRVARAEGPERVAPEWWREPGGAGARTRDYYRVEDEAGRRYWVFRAGFFEDPADRPRWFLHGLFA